MTTTTEARSRWWRPREDVDAGNVDRAVAKLCRRRMAFAVILCVLFFVQFMHNAPTKHYRLPSATLLGVVDMVKLKSLNSTVKAYTSGNSSTMAQQMHQLLLLRVIDSHQNNATAGRGYVNNPRSNLSHATTMTFLSEPYKQHNAAYANANSMDWAVPFFQQLFRKPRHENTTFVDDSCMDETCLLNAALPFYVYPEDSLFSDGRYFIHNLTNKSLNSNPDVRPLIYREGAMYEIAIFHALMNHPLRTTTQEEAHLFVLPIPLGTIVFSETKRNENMRLFLEIRKNLRQSSPFQQGKPHVLVSMTSPIFNPTHRRLVGRGLKTLYRVVKSVVSVARSDDYVAMLFAYRHNVTPGNDFSGYDEQFATLLPITEHQFSVGLGGEAHHMPLITPTWDKFQNSTFYIFYHTRTSPSLCNSTAFRHAPLLNVSLEALPRSSIGWSIDARQWKQGFIDSKFCLVIRGDTPHSHALFNAIKVGCIPVVVSDWYPFFAPPFPTTLDMRDFCIFIPEDYFLRHTQEALQSLQYIPDDVLQAKLSALKWAQRVVLVDHPRSLFVPAFVREAVASFSRPASKMLQ